jgi:hypothetical protein
MNYVSMSQLAKELKLDVSNARKYIIKQGFSFIKIRTLDSRNQLTLALTQEDAETLYELRRNQGFGQSSSPVENGCGFFYIVRPLPDIAPARIKVGWTNNPQSRLSAYKTITPDAELLQTWPCRETWERAAIASVTRIGCQRIGVELFLCADVAALQERANAFFALLPQD